MITYEQFHRAIENLKRFTTEQDKLKSVLQVISPTGTGVVEFGNQFIDDYIDLIELALEHEYGLVSWFIFDNEFGQKNLVINFHGIEYVISSIRDIYDFILM
jgi:hypothetical protein